VDLLSLRAAVTVADTLHFGRAAQRLDIAQPQVSQRVRKLEKELGFDIFVRSHHNVSLTAAGARVVQHAGDVLAAADRLSHVARGLRTGTAGVVRIGCVGSAMFGALTQILARCRTELPDVHLQVREMESPDQVASLRNGSLDLGFLRPPGPRELRLRDVWSEPLVVALPAEDPLTDLEVVPTSSLTGRRVVVFPREAGPGYWDQIVAALADADVLLEQSRSADHITTLLGMVALGEGMTLVPASLIGVQLPGVAYRPLDPVTTLRLSVAVAPGEPGPATKRVLDTVPSLR
jgi:DNA-binding transcriptional LysR family regulator